FVLTPSVKQSEFYQKLTQPPPAQSAQKTATGSVDDDAFAVTILGEQAGIAGSTGDTEDSGTVTTAIEAEAMLTAGIQDITASLVGEFNLNDLLRMVLETMYRSLGFTRALLCIADARQKTMNGKIGFGLNIDQIVPHFRFPTAFAADCFHIALAKGIDIQIDDIDADNIRQRVPTWYRTLIPAKSLVLFPLIVGGKPIGLIYADADQRNGITIAPKELNQLRTLRNQAVLAIKQKL
ncbi:MAG: GAF domain-containing protein, partial [Burkholderiales bacterium]